jgi:hypothetical protein
MRTATQELEPEYADFVKRQLQTPPPPPRDGGEAPDGGVREPKRPSLPTPSGDAAAPGEALASGVARMEVALSRPAQGCIAEHWRTRR